MDRKGRLPLRRPASGTRRDARLIGESRKLVLFNLEWGAVADSLDQDVQALKEWLRGAWRYLAEPSTTRFERQQLRNYIKEADAALRAGLQKIAAREKARQESYEAFRGRRTLPDFHILDFKAE